MVPSIYTFPSLFVIESSIDNTAGDVQGVVYAEIQPAAPCLFAVVDFSVTKHSSNIIIMMS